MIEERKTHYSDMKYCERTGEDILVKQMRVPGDSVVVECQYTNPGGNCLVSGSDSGRCPLNSKLVNVIRG